MSHDPSVHSLRGLSAIVTGASRGIGRAIALGYAQAGADVVINHATDQPVPQEMVDLIGAHGGRAVAVQADVGNLAEHAKLVDAALAHFGRIDILVNNAAMKRKTPVLEVTEAMWDETLRVNLKGAFFLAQRVAQVMVSAGTPGRIINITSIHESKPLNNASLYAISKSGLGMVTQALALELAPHRITVNSLIPGAYLTHMNLDTMLDPARREASGKKIPLGRLGEPEDLVAAAILLASPQSDYLTGTSIKVDGGGSLR